MTLHRFELQVGEAIGTSPCQSCPVVAGGARTRPASSASRPAESRRRSLGSSALANLQAAVDAKSPGRINVMQCDKDGRCCHIVRRRRSPALQGCNRGITSPAAVSAIAWIKWRRDFPLVTTGRNPRLDTLGSPCYFRGRCKTFLPNLHRRRPPPGAFPGVRGGVLRGASAPPWVSADLRCRSPFHCRCQQVPTCSTCLTPTQ